MTTETIALGVLAGFFIWRLYKAFDRVPPSPKDKIKLISPQTGEILEMQIISAKSPDRSAQWDEERFIRTAQMIFREILSAFSCGRLKSVASLMSPEVYQAFEREIMARQVKKQKMEFSLICFDSTKIISQTEHQDQITVRFQTEQINLLKDEQGRVLEGDPMTVAVMEDTWIFRKTGKLSWMLVSTNSRKASCAG